MFIILVLGDTVEIKPDLETGLFTLMFNDIKQQRFVLLFCFYFILSLF